MSDRSVPKQGTIYRPWPDLTSMCKEASVQCFVVAALTTARVSRGQLLIHEFSRRESSGGKERLRVWNCTFLGSDISKLGA